MAIKQIKIGSNEAIDIHDARIVAIDSALSTSSDNIVKNKAVALEFEKVGYVGEEYETVSDVPEPEPAPQQLYEHVANKVTSLSSSSTDNQYPSAKCVYDLVGNIETLLAAL